MLDKRKREGSVRAVVDRVHALQVTFCSSFSIEMPSFPILNSFGKLCGSSNSKELVLEKVKFRNSVKRMSIIEDGDIAEVLYLIPKQSILKQLPYLNPDDYYLCERLFDDPEDLGK